MGRVTPGKAALDAGMAVVRLAILIGHHAHEFVAAHLRLEGAADAAIGAGRDDRMFRLADVVKRFFRERRGRAGLHAGAAGYAFGIEEIFHLAGRNTAFKTASIDRQGERTLHFFAGAHAAIADDALRRIVSEIGIGRVLGALQVVFTFVAITDFAQADDAGLRLQFAIAIGGAGQTVERMIGDVEFHHAVAQRLQARRLRMDDHARSDRRRAGGGRAVAAFDLDETETAGAKGVHAVGGAKLRDLITEVHRGAHDRRTGGHVDLGAIDRQLDRRARFRGRCAVIGFVDERHPVLLIPLRLPRRGA